jgi:hypothetical protein
MTKSNAQPPQVSRGHCTKLQGWPGELPRGRGAHQGGRGGPRGCQMLLGSIIRSGSFLTYDGYAPVSLTYSNGPRYIFRDGQTESEIAANNQCGGSAPLVGPPAPPIPAGSQCTDEDELTDYTQTANSACCDGNNPCKDGLLPQSCSQECATVLLPMQSACASFLSQGGMALAPLKSLIDTTAALCPQSPNECTTMEEFNAYAARVTAECCDEPTESCSSGIPNTCNDGCAAVLLPMQASCSDFLSGLIYRELKSTIDAAAAHCDRGGH